MTDPLLPWPRFDSVELSGADLPQHLASRFRQLRVPSHEIGGPTAEPALSLILTPDGSELILFGRYGMHLVMCLDPRTGHVVDMVQSQGKIVRGPLLTNSSLSQFIATTMMATELVPYHDNDPDTDLQAAADNLLSQLKPIDPPAWEHDGFWINFYWDVASGVYFPGQFEPPPESR